MVSFSSKTLELSGLFLLVFSEGTNFVSLKTNVSEVNSQSIEAETKHGGRYPVYKEIHLFTVNGTVSPLLDSVHRST